MEINTLQINNVGKFSNLTLDFVDGGKGAAAAATILVGGNGSGKTTILKSIATALSWFVARIRNEKGVGTQIPELVLTNGENSASISVTVCDCLDDFQLRPILDQNFSWTISKTKSGRNSESTSSFSELNKLVGHYRNQLSSKPSSSLPLVAFYSVERVVLDVPLKIRGKHSFEQLDGYDNSLNQGVDFRRFFEWFREREDTENESGITAETLEKLLEILGPDSNVWARLKDLQASSRDRQLTAVRAAISSFMPEFRNLRVKRRPRLHMSVEKNGKALNVLQLSQGEKSLLALVGDIARRLAMMNPEKENPLEGQGIILIDEIDLHLHPSWQRDIISRLRVTFPNCQFIATTHSALVISDVDDVLLFSLDGERLSRVPPQFGQDANTVLIDVMDTPARNAAIQREIDAILDDIQDCQLALARVKIDALAEKLPPGNIEITRAKVLLAKQEIRHAKNNKG